MMAHSGRSVRFNKAFNLRCLPTNGGVEPPSLKLVDQNQTSPKSAPNAPKGGAFTKKQAKSGIYIYIVTWSVALPLMSVNTSPKQNA